LVAAADPSINRNLDRGGGPVSVAQQTKTAANPARSQALFRELNEEIRRIADSFGIDEDLELVCECEHGDCFARLPVSPDDYETVRRFPTRFLIKPEHVGADDRIVHETARYVVVEKIGPSAETAILRDPRKRALQRPAA
jgi:hypothetical protein